MKEQQGAPDDWERRVQSFLRQKLEKIRQSPIPLADFSVGRPEWKGPEHMILPVRLVTLTRQKIYRLHIRWGDGDGDEDPVPEPVEVEKGPFLALEG